ncbi:hypothetical protein D3C74_181390 [compost metagenome]
MFQIDTFQDMQTVCKHKDVLPESACRLLEDFFGQLQLSLEPENKLFCLSDHGYALFVLKPGKAFSIVQLENMSINVEYAERINLGDYQLVKLCLMEDNDSFTFLFSMVGTQAEDVENWLDSLVEGSVHP